MSLSFPFAGSYLPFVEIVGPQVTVPTGMTATGTFCATSGPTGGGGGGGSGDGGTNGPPVTSGGSGGGSSSSSSGSGGSSGLSAGQVLGASISDEEFNNTLFRNSKIQNPRSLGVFGVDLKEGGVCIS